MHELTFYLLTFSAAGLLAGAVLGIIGSRTAFRIALGLGCFGAIWLGISAAFDHGWGRIGKMVYAALIVWAVLVGAGVYAAIRARHHAVIAREKRRAE